MWEYPDLFPLALNDKTYWVLFVHLSPGGPNGGSATQYFVGNLDGHAFTPLNDKIKFASRATAPRLTTTAKTDLILYFDAASVELFADQGLTTMTEIFFPSQPFTTLRLRSSQGLTFQQASGAALVSQPAAQPNSVSTGGQAGW